MKRLILLSIIVIFYSLESAASEPFIPKSEDFVVAQWPTQKSTLTLNEQIKTLLDEAIYPGNSANYATAANLLKQTSADDLQTVERLYYDAVVKQHYHQFEASKTALLTLLKTKSQDANALLMLSNMYSLLGEHRLAERTCVQLIAVAEQAIVATCALNAKAQTGDVKAILKQLSIFLDKTNNLRAGTSIWAAEVYASLARAAGEFELAEKILTPYVEQKVPVSFWVLWSDIQLDLSKPENVISRVGSIVNDTRNQDDALLLRLAIAEGRLQLPNKVWLEKVRSRVNLRESRQDHEHAYDIALYYFYIEQQYKTAHHWALINWEQAKLFDDANLLQMTRFALQSPPSDEENVGVTK